MPDANIFKGTLTALVTPFKNGKVAEERYRALIDWQIEQGIDGLVPCGTTGESATLSHEEHRRVIDICVDQVKGRVPVLAGAGSNNTAEATALAQHAKEAGADGILLITPYYNKPTQEGLFAHFKAIADEVSIPTVVYNVPGRTSVNVEPQTLARMHEEIPEVVGVKEATGDMKQCSRIVERCGENFALISGDDFTVLPLLAIGGVGVISVVANIVPQDMSNMVRAFRNEEYVRAKLLHYKMQPLYRAMFLETNPVPVKTSLAYMGKLDFEVRLPMVPMRKQTDMELRTSLSDYGLI